MTAEWLSAVPVERSPGSFVDDPPPPPAIAVPWPETPDLPGPPDPDPLPLNALPDVLAGMARTIAETTQAPLDAAIGAVLGAVSVAVVGKVRVEIEARRAWVKPAHTYVGIQLGSGVGKSPLIGFVRRPIQQWEAARAEEERSRRRQAEEEVRLCEERLKAMRKAAVNDFSPDAQDALEAAVIALGKAERAPRGEFQLLISDATEEEMVRVMAGNVGRVASVDPEGTILEVAAGRYGNGDARLAALTHGWDGEAMRVNRVSRAAVDIPSANVALLLGLQPGILEGMINAETMAQRGVLARFLWIAPVIDWDLVRTGMDVPDLDREAVRRFELAITRILDTPDFSDSSEPSHLLKMSAEAQEGVYRLEEMKVAGIRPGGWMNSIEAFAGKLPDHGARIAALLTVAQRADEGTALFRDPIPGWAMRSAERLLRAIATHVLKVTGDGGGDAFTADLRYLLDLAVKMNGSTESEIREVSRARKQFRDAERVRDLFDNLERRGCIRRQDQPSKPGPGRNPSPLIFVHEALRPSDQSDLTPENGLKGNSSDKSEAFPGPEPETVGVPNLLGDLL